MKTYDTKCYDLAMAFLSDIPGPDKLRENFADRLAREIQEIIEDACRDFEESVKEEDE
jgi:hypothetical protein